MNFRWAIPVTQANSRSGLWWWHGTNRKLLAPNKNSLFSENPDFSNLVALFYQFYKIIDNTSMKCLNFDSHIHFVFVVWWIKIFFVESYKYESLLWFHSLFLLLKNKIRKNKYSMQNVIFLRKQLEYQSQFEILGPYFWRKSHLQLFNQSKYITPLKFDHAVLARRQ